MNADYIILLALKDEAPNLVGKPGVFFTGVGKVNAAITAAKLIERYNPKRVFNFGTAGCISDLVPNKLYRINHFSQRDLYLSGCITEQELIAEMSPILLNVNGVRLSTGDNFVTNSTGIEADLVDMEGYAIAKACKYADVEFICYKYISDMADENASQHFANQVHKGEEYYIKVLQEYGYDL